jgi:glutamyl-tRNA reductase
MIPLALVGMSYREAPSAVRAALVELDSEAGGPARQLLDAGEISGVVRIESCARVEWLLASERPAWAAELFGAALTGAAENPDRVRPRVPRAAAVGGLLRVAAGSIRWPRVNTPSATRCCVLSSARTRPAPCAAICTWPGAASAKL